MEKRHKNNETVFDEPVLPSNKDTDARYGLVLGGGGAKGCYHVGVWQAMNEAGIHFDALTGTSIGALVGIFYPGNNIKPVTDFVMNMQPGHVAQDLPKLPSTVKETIQGSATYLQFIRKYRESRMDITPLKERFSEMFDYESFHNSPVRYACMTYNETKQEAYPFYKGQITSENAQAIVMASSACYPVFPKVEFNGDVFMDGMYADNVPIALLGQIFPEADRVVVVDLHDPGEPKPPALKDDMVYIQPILMPGHPLDFSREHAEKLYRQGYLDTRKVLGYDAGYVFTFNPDDKALMDIVETYLARQFEQFHIELPAMEDLPGYVYKAILGYRPGKLHSPFMDHYEYGQYVEALAILAKMDPTGYYGYRQFFEQMMLNLANLKESNSDGSEFALVELLSSVRREESVWMMYRLIKAGNGHLPARIESLKDRFAASYVLGYVRYFLEGLAAELGIDVAASSKMAPARKMEYLPAILPGTGEDADTKNK